MEMTAAAIQQVIGVRIGGRRARGVLGGSDLLEMRVAVSVVVAGLIVRRFEIRYGED